MEIAKPANVSTGKVIGCGEPQQSACLASRCRQKEGLAVRGENVASGIAEKIVRDAGSEYTAVTVWISLQKV